MQFVKATHRCVNILTVLSLIWMLSLVQVTVACSRPCTAVQDLHLVIMSSHSSTMYTIMIICLNFETILVYVAKTINCTWTLQSYFKASFTVDTYGLQYG